MIAGITSHLIRQTVRFFDNLDTTGWVALGSMLGVLVVVGLLNAYFGRK